MRIAVPVDYDSYDAGVSLSFARAPYFLVFDELGMFFIENSVPEDGECAGRAAANFVRQRGVDVVAALAIGKNARKELARLGIGMFRAGRGTAVQAAKDCSEGLLEPLGV